MLEQLEMDLFDDENFEFYPEVEYNANDVYPNEGPLRMSLFGRRASISKYYDDFQTIDWQKERSHSHARKVYYSNLKYGPFIAKLQWLYEKSSVLLVLALVGITCSITSFIVSMGVHFFSDLRDGVCSTGLLFNKHECCWNSTFSDEGCSNWVTWSQLFVSPESSSSFFINYLFYFAISILLSLVSAVVVYYVAPYASGGGITELKMILSGFIMRGFLGFITYIVKTATLILSASSGLLLGQEGPMVHIACCIANLYIRLFPKFWENEADKREILTASTAVGMATAFNSPLTGVLFTLEETSFYFTAGVLWKSFYGAMIGVFILASFLPYSTGNIVLYSVSSADWHEFEIPIFALIGIIGGLYGALFTKMIFYWDRLKQKLRLNKYPIAEVVLVTALTVLISFPLEFSK